MAAPISKEDYLKRYLSDNAEEKKKKRRKKAHTSVKVSRVTIFDDDIDLKSLQPDNLGNTFDDDVGDNEPTVAEFVDERPEHIKLLEKYRLSGAWKTFEKTEERQSKKRHNSDSDNSPPRRNRHDSNSDQSSLRRQRHDSDSDQSPSRRQRHDSDSDHSPVRKQRHDSDSDQSPARKQRHDSDSDQSPPRKKHSKSKSETGNAQKHSKLKHKRNDSDSDQSPRRKKTKTSSSRSKTQSTRTSGHKSDSDQSPRRRRQNSDSDPSPLRRLGNKSDSDQSPPRRRGNESDSDQSPPRRWGNESDSDQSPPRRRRNKSDSNESPPRKHKSFKSKDPAQNGSRIEKGSKKKEEMTLGGKKAGLSSAKDMRREAEELRRKEDESFGKISDDRLGKGSATVFRDKSSGRKRDLVEEKKKASEEAKKKEKEDVKFKQWGKGLKQIEEQSQQLETDLYETSKPLARYKDDEDLDKMLRDMHRAEDPMLAFIKKKKSKTTGPPVNEKPRYKGPAPPPNRFGLMPGYRWDGVDRSNGFEKQMFSKIAEKKATAIHAYKWSTEDM